MSLAKKSVAKPRTKSSKIASAPAQKRRVRKAQSHKSFRLSKRISSPHPPLPGALRLWSQTVRLVFSNKKLFFGIIGVHVVLSVIFVRGFGISTELVDLKLQVEELLGGSVNQLGSSIALFGYLATTMGSEANDVSGAYRIFLTLVTSLAVIWAARQVLAGEKPVIREAYYRGMYPLIPFILVLLVIVLQFLPALIGNAGYGVIIERGLAITAGEKLIVLFVVLLLVLLSLYMALSSIFALYISTLPDMTPMKALRSARGLVMHRRWPVGLRIIALPVMLLALVLIIILPLIIFAPLLAEPVFFVMSSLGLLFTNLYLYNLYRALI